jgi:photosystem II stability/assembly factor-like uncharacterized protein
MARGDPEMGGQLWAVGDNGTILRFEAEAGRWEAQSSGTANNLDSILSSSDGAEVWVGEARLGHWYPPNGATRRDLLSISSTNDGAQLWAVGDFGTILLICRKALGH